MAGTALAWHEALTHGRQFDEARDVQRFRAAFRTLAARSRRWPAPIDFIEALPRVGLERETPRIESDGARQMGQRAIADIAAKLRIEPVKPHTEVDHDSAA